MRKRILILGSNGQLGRTFQNISKNYPYEFVFCDSKMVDITNLEQTNSFLHSQPSFDVVINCAAYTKVDQSEEEQDLALNANAHALKNLINSLDEKTVFIHYSTDYVFDGKGHKPYSEQDPVNPVNYYGFTKLKGEEIIVNSNKPNTFIIRTSWVYAPFGSNFVQTILRLSKSGNPLRIVSDQIGTPTYTFDLAHFTLDYLIPSRSEQPRIFHYSNQGVCSWYDFAKEILDLSGLPNEVIPIPTTDFPTKAIRPYYSVLSKQKLLKTYEGIVIPHWKESLKKCLCMLTSAED